jgi:outer membrane protein TolC
MFSQTYRKNRRRGCKTAEQKESYESLIEVALDHRHDYQAAIFETEIAKSAVQLAKARFYPTVDGVWNFNKVDNPAFTQEKDFWVASVQIKMPIFERSLPIWNLQEKKMTLQQADLALEDLNKAIRLEIKCNAYSGNIWGNFGLQETVDLKKL